MIPGPIEVTDDVLYANAHPSVAHVAPDFCVVFGECIKMLRTVLDAPSSQPYIVAGSGTLGWDMLSANVLQPGEEALVLSTGYFGDSFAEALGTYGVKVTQITGAVGGRPEESQIVDALQKTKFRAVTITHVDTSTGVLMDVEKIAKLVHEVSPETLVFVDGVCSVGSEEIHMESWGVDAYLFASQKGLGCPPGLSFVVAGPRAMQAFESRKAPPATYYASWVKWTPVMKAYEAGSPAYFGTPPTNLVYALHQSLKNITGTSLAERYQAHREASQKIKTRLAEHGLEQLALKATRENGGVANGMTAVRYPAGMGAKDILPKLAQRGVVFGAGLHKECKDEYFRIGHMGVSVMDPKRGDLDKVITALREVLQENGVKN